MSCRRRKVPLGCRSSCVKDKLKCSHRFPTGTSRKETLRSCKKQARKTICHKITFWKWFHSSSYSVTAKNIGFSLPCTVGDLICCKRLLLLAWVSWHYQVLNAVSSTWTGEAQKNPPGRKTRSNTRIFIVSKSWMEIDESERYRGIRRRTYALLSSESLKRQVYVSGDSKWLVKETDFRKRLAAGSLRVDVFGTYGSRFRFPRIRDDSWNPDGRSARSGVMLPVTRQWKREVMIIHERNGI